MSLLKLFSGPSPEKLEEKGDGFFAAGHWGQAKLAYDGSLDKRQKRSGPDVEAQRRLAEKIRAVADALAEEHRQTAQDLIDGGYDEEARALLALAAEVAADPRLKSEIGAQLQALTHSRHHPAGLAPFVAAAR
ncbi:MAG: hypothetical protein WAM61_09715, partial [Desulfobacterales bacterium]